VATVTSDVVLLVGRASVRGLKLASGTPAWEALALPAGGGPSGRGYLSDGRYYLPLASAEVGVIDAASGRLLHRVKSIDGRAPGNLICGKEHVISQGPEGIECFPRLEGMIAAAAAALAQRPNDPAAMAEYGRMLLARGEHTVAITQLRRSLEIRQDDATRSILCDAVLQALAADFAAHRQTADDLAATFRAAGLEAAYLRSMASGLRRSGEHLAAFDALLALADRDDRQNELEASGAARYARRNVWLRGELADLLSASTREQHAELDRRIEARVAQAVASKDPGKLDQCVKLLADHAAVCDARDLLITSLFDSATGKLRPTKARPLSLQRLLLEVQAGSDAARARAATARLARMMLAHDRPEEAAMLYRRLNTDLADLACLDGKTGRQLFADLPASSPVRRVLDAPGAWPPGLVEKQTTAGSSPRVAPTILPLNIEAARNNLLDELRLEVTANVSPQKIIARDVGGNERWSIELKTPDGGNFNVSPQTLRAKLDGHLLFVWQANRVFAIDLLAADARRPEILWSKDLTAKFPGMDGSNPYAQQVVFFGGGVPVFATTDAYGRPVAEIGPVTGRLVCYQRLRTVMAVDPLTGETLWTRHDVPRGCELLGDDEVILAVPRDSTAAMVLRATDGRELGRCEVPDKRDRLAVLGRRIVTWQGDDERQTLKLLDPWKGDVTWSREFSAGTKLSRVGLDEAGVLDPQGNFTVVALANGEPKFRARVKAPANLVDIHVMRSRERYVLLAKQSAPAVAADKAAEKVVYPMTLGGQVEMVSGTLYSFDRATGELQWQTALDQRGFDLSQSPHWPIVVFAERVYYQSEKATRRYETKVTCLDKRDGRVVFEETTPQAGSQLQVLADAATHSIELRTGRSTTKLIFTGKAEPAK
jgi:outer membrane protein assembly factor BamB